MASPGELVAAVAKALAVPEPTVSQFDRILAADSLRTKGGRGSSAAKITAADAANLLIAIAASPMAGPTVKSASQTCRGYSGLVALNMSDRPTTFPGASLQVYELEELPAGHSFRDAVASIVDCARADVLDRAAKFSPRKRWNLFVTIESPIPKAAISLDTGFGNERVSYGPRPSRTTGPKSIWPGDLYQTRHFGAATVKLMAALLGPLKPTELREILSRRFSKSGASQI